MTWWHCGATNIAGGLNISHTSTAQKGDKKTATLPSKNEGFPEFQARPTGRDQIWTRSCWMLGGSKRLMWKRLSRKLKQQSCWKHQSPMGLTPSETTVIETNHVTQTWLRCALLVPSEVMAIFTRSLKENQLLVPCHVLGAAWAVCLRFLPVDQRHSMASLNSSPARLRPLAA